MNIVDFINTFWQYIEQATTLNLIAIGGKILFVITITAIVIKHAWGVIIAILSSPLYISKIIVYSIIHKVPPKPPQQIKDLKHYPLFSFSHYFRAINRICQFTSKCYQAGINKLPKKKKVQNPLNFIDSILDEQTELEKKNKAQSKNAQRK